MERPADPRPMKCLQRTCLRSQGSAHAQGGSGGSQWHACGGGDGTRVQVQCGAHCRRISASVVLAKLCADLMTADTVSKAPAETALGDADLDLGGRAAAGGQERCPPVHCTGFAAGQGPVGTVVKYEDMCLQIRQVSEKEARRCRPCQSTCSISRGYGGGQPGYPIVSLGAVCVGICG